jgi:DNA-binding CsgD family transcriptional regulator
MAHAVWMGQELAGRDAELDLLRQWLAGRAGAGQHGPPVALVSGEAGVGKTALVESALAGHLETGRAVLVGRGAGSPWYPVAFGVLRAAVPGWDGTPDPAALRTAILEVAAGRPAVLFLDDLHWSDAASLELLAGLVEAVAADPVAVIGAYRGDELPRTHLLRPVRAALRHRRWLSEITLAALDSAAVVRMISGLLGAEPAPELTTVVASRTEGLPFFVEELTEALSEAGRLVADGSRITLSPAPELPVPATVRDAVLLRVAGLPETARAALEVAAVMGTEFDVESVQALASWPDELDHCGLVAVADDGSGHFRHALAQEAVYTDIPRSRRRALHLAMAERLADGGSGALPMARHLLAGGDVDRARQALLQAADDQMRAHAYRDAARALREALDLWRPGADDAARLAATDRLARCAELAGEHTEAISLLRELAEEYRDQRALATVHRRLALQHELLGHWSRALAAREQAATGFAAAGDAGEAAVERLAAAARLRLAASYHMALDLLATARDDAVRANRVDLQALAEGLRGNLRCRVGRVDEGMPAVRAALDLALSQGLSAPASELYKLLADSLEHAGDYRAAAHAYDSAYEFCQSHGDEAVGQLCQACATVVMFHSGRWKQAVRVCHAVAGNPTAQPHPRSVATGVLGLVHAMRGQAEAARAALLESHSIATRIGLVPMELLSSWGLALVEDVVGNPGAAVEEYRRILQRWSGTEERHYCVPILHFAAAHFAASSAPAELNAATEALTRIAEATGQPEARSALAYALGEAAPAPQAALPQYRRALDLLSGLELPIVDSQIRWRTGLVLLENGEHDEAAANLRQAYRTLHRLGARPMADRIRAQLGELESQVPAQLSARERQVLGLVAEGQTSRQIGQQLFLSTRTVEMHVQNAMTKLGCRSRAEAVHLLGQQHT